MSKFEDKMKKLMNLHSEEINKIREKKLDIQRAREEVLEEERRKFALITPEINTFIDLIKKKFIKGLKKVEIFENRKLILEHENIDYYGPIIERYFAYGSDNDEQKYSAWIETTTIHEDGSFEGRKERQTKKILFEDKNELLSHLHDTVEAILEKDIEDRNN